MAVFNVIEVALEWKLHILTEKVCSSHEYPNLEDFPLLSKWIRNCETVDDCHAILDKGRKKLQQAGMLLSVENLPLQNPVKS